MTGRAKQGGFPKFAFTAALLLVLAACGGDSDGTSSRPVTQPATGFRVGGSVTGLATGATLTLLDNDSDVLSLTSNGAFTFATSLGVGGTYAVTVKTQPTGQTCTVSAANGTAAANVSNIKVSCAAITFTIGGSLTGLNSGAALTLLDNNSDSLAISSNGAFTFPTALTANSAYAVTVSTQPAGQTCTVNGGSGTVTANVTNLAVACGNAPFALLQLGHSARLLAIQMTESRVLSQDHSGTWLLSGLKPDVTVASGTSGCLTANCVEAVYASNNSPIPTALAGQTAVIETPSGLEIRAASDGHIEGTIPGPLAWWQLASDGSYVATGSTTALQIWSQTGTNTFSLAGNYAGAVAFAAPGQIRVALGAAGTNVIQTLAVPAGTATVGPTFNGVFSSWFLDGGRFLTNTAQTVWVYSATSVQQDLTQLPSVAGLTGQGNWFWIQAPGQGSAVSVYAVGSSAAPAATYPSVWTASASGLTLGLFPYGIAQVTVVDFSGVTLSSQTHSLPVAFNTVLAATSAAKFVVGNDNGVVVDGTTLSGTPQFLSLGAAQSIAGGGNVAAIATAAGKLYVINPATRVVQNSFDFSSGRVQLSLDGTVLAAVYDFFDYQYSIEPPTLKIFSLPAGTLTNTFTGTDVSSIFSLSGSGALIETGPGISAIAGGAILWPASTGLTSLLFSTIGNDFVTTAQNTSCPPTTNFYVNYTLANTIAGSPAGWADQNRVLVNAYQPGLSACTFKFTSSSIYDSTGTLVSATNLPELKSIQPVSADTVYSHDRNAIYSLTSGAATYTGPSVSAYASPGAVAGPYVVYPFGASVVAVEY